MKKLLLPITLLLILFACNDNDSGQNSTDRSAATLAAPVIKWRIPKATADSMMSYYDTCTVGCDDTNEIRDWNPGIYRQIAAFVGAGNAGYVPARYWPSNENRYCSNRPGTGGPGGMAPHCRVAGHWTMIVRASLREASLTDEDLYFDIVTICPPPEDAHGNCALPFIPPGPDSTKLDSAKKVKTTETK